MNITETHVRLHSNGKLRAFASITIDDWLVVRGLKIIEKATGDLFVAMPTREDTGKDICHPVHREGRDYLTEHVLRRYHEMIALRESEPERTAAQSVASPVEYASRSGVGERPFARVRAAFSPRPA